MTPGDVRPLRQPFDRDSDEADEVRDYAARVRTEAFRLLEQYPDLAGEDARVLFSRMVTPETAPGFESLLRRAAFGVLAARAQDREDTMDPTTGDAA